MIRSIMIRGDFSDDEFAELAQAVRMIERRHPERAYELWCADPEGSTETGRALVEQALRGPSRH